jgi:hypothetical protein
MNIMEEENSGDLDIINNNIKTDLQTIEFVGDFIFCGSSYDEVGIAEFDWEGAD